MGTAVQAPGPKRESLLRNLSEIFFKILNLSFSLQRTQKKAESAPINPTVRERGTHPNNSNNHEIQLLLGAKCHRLFQTLDMLRTH